MEIPDSEESSVSLQSVCNQTAGPKNIHCRVKTPTASLAAESKDNTEEESVSQPGTDAKNDVWLKRLFGKITDTFYYFSCLFSKHGSRYIGY